MVHKIKCEPRFFEESINGNKPFEHRFNDRDYQVNDTLILQEWDPAKKDYTGREATFTVPYILSDYEGLTPGYVIMAMLPIQH